MSIARAPLAAVAALGAVLSAYLTWVHWSGDLALCLGAGGCELVQASRFAVVGPVPVALIGLTGFSALLVTALLWTRARAWAGTVALAIALAATLYVAYLTYLELFVIGAVCPWCVGVAVCAVASLALVVRDIATESSAPAPQDLSVSG
jgi:uncharacterized membrane protein